jgi:hypothetical protein
MMNRRRFLFGGLLAVGVAGLGIIGFGPSGAEAYIVRVVRQRLSFLKLDEAGLHAFAKAQVDTLLAKRPTWNRMKYHFMSIFTKKFSHYDYSNDKRSRRERIADGFAQTYLLSSDFFRNKADESQVVHYVVFFDPMIPCQNPFARSPPDDGNAI